MGEAGGPLRRVRGSWRGVTCRAQELLRGLNLGSRGHAVPSLAVALALEGKASHRELTSRLLSDLVGRVVTPEDIAWAFDKMLRDLPDLILDTPEAPQVLAGVGRGQGWDMGGTWLCWGMLGGAVAVPGGPWPCRGQALTLRPQLLGQFIARAVADHALPLDFLERYKGRVDCEHAR